MKRLFMAIAIFFLLAGVACAGSLTIGWDTLSCVDCGVRIYIGTETGGYTNSHDAGVGVDQTIIENLLPGVTYYFAAKAYNPQGVYSGLSDECSGSVAVEEILPPLPLVDVPEPPMGVVVQPI